MMQEIFRIPGLDIPIFGYGLMMVLGFLAGAQLAKYLARRHGLDGEAFVNAALLALISGVFGARLSHVLENLGAYTDPSRSAWANFADAINIRSGGLTFYGGLLVATPVLIAYGLWKKIPLRLGMDIVAPCVMVGLAFGRIGCFLNGCCYGAECHAPWAVQFPYGSNAYVEGHQDGTLDHEVPAVLFVPTASGGHRLATPAEAAADPALRPVAAAEKSDPVHPAQLYSAFNAFLIAGVLLAYFTLPHAPGRVFALMFLLKGASRFVLEMLRNEPAVLGPMSFSMVVSIGLIVAGVLLWVLFGKLGPEASPAVAAREPAPAAA